MNKFFNIILLSLFICSNFAMIEALDKSATTKQHINVKCSPQLQSCFNRIQMIPEARELIAAIQEEGAIQIKAKNTDLSEQFGAFWDGEERVICIALSSGITADDIIGSIIFELQNAAVDSKFVYYNNLANQGNITKAKYIESMEYLEYENSLKAAKMAEKGIKMGVIPAGARLPTYSSFKEHYAAQKMSGHSDCFAGIYDNLAPQNSRSRRR